MKSLIRFKTLLIIGLMISLSACGTLPTLPPTISPADLSTDTPAPKPILPASTDTASPIPTRTRVISTPTAAATSTPTLLPQFQKPTATLSLLPVSLSTDGTACLPKNTQTDLGIVTKVVSGDTIEAIVNGQEVIIGYLGIQAPTLATKGKIGGFYAQNSLQRNTQLTDGQIITLVKDTSEQDSRGRLLRYVLANNLFVNFELVNHGYAVSIWPSSDSACRSEFDAAQDTARKSLTGMWLVTPTPFYVPSEH